MKEWVRVSVRNIFWYPLNSQAETDSYLHQRSTNASGLLWPSHAFVILLSLISTHTKHIVFSANKLVYGQNITVYEVIMNLFGWVIVFYELIYYEVMVV